MFVSISWFDQPYYHTRRAYWLHYWLPCRALYLVVFVALCAYMLLHIAPFGRCCTHYHAPPPPTYDIVYPSHCLCNSTAHAESYTDVTVDVHHMMMHIVSRTICCHCVMRMHAVIIRFAWLCTCPPACQHMATAISLDKNLPLTVMCRASAPCIAVICIVCCVRLICNSKP